MSDVSKIYRGPLTDVSIGDAGSSTLTSLGYLGGNSAEITFDKVGYQLGDGQEVQLFGMGKVTIELVQTDTVNIGLINIGSPRKLVLTAADGKKYTIDNILVGYSTKRGFGDEPHILTITAQKKVADEDDFVVITTT